MFGIRRKSKKDTSAQPDLPLGAATCPACGQILDTVAAYCSKCGKNLKAEAISKEKRRKQKRRARREMERMAGPKYAQCTNDLAGFEYCFETGEVESAPGVYSTTVEFGDVSYENERRDVKNDKFDKFAEIHSLFSAPWSYQLCLCNFPTYTSKVDRFLPEVGETEDLARAYNDIIEERQRAGRTDFVHRNFLTMAIEAPTLDEAKVQLGPTTDSVISGFSRMDVRAKKLDGEERMKLMHEIMRGPGEPYTFSYDRLRETNKVRARDFVAPAWAVYPAHERHIRRFMYMPNRVVKSFLIRDFGGDLSDRALRTIRAHPIPMTISLTFRPQPKGKVTQEIQRNIAVVQAEKFSYQSKVARAGGDITTLPPAMEAKEADNLELLDYIRDANEQIGWFQGIITVYAENEARMEEYERMLMDDRGTFTIEIVELPTYQEEAFTSSLPLATPRLENQYRSLSTSERSALIPFSSQNISDNPKTSLLLGIDRVSGGSLLVDLAKLKSPHMFLFGMTGGGKSMQVNSILTHSQLQYPRTRYDDTRQAWVCEDESAPQWFVIDWHSEYRELGVRLGAKNYSFGPGHTHCLNPMDMSNPQGALSAADVRANTDFFIALSQSLLDHKLQAREKSLIDRVLRDTYEPYIGTTTRPTMVDFYERLKEIEAEEYASGAYGVAHALREAYELYAVGSMDSFAHKTNVEDDPQLNIYDMSEVGQTMQTLAVLSVLQHVRQATFANYNREVPRPTYLIFEEAQVIFGNDAAVNLLDSYFSELRKFGLRIMCVTQLPNRVLAHPKARNLFENTGLFVFLPNQQSNADTIAEMFRLSAAQADMISQNAPAGTGLVIADGVKVGMSNMIPKDNPLYAVWNTDPNKATRTKAA